MRRHRHLLSSTDHRDFLEAIATLRDPELAQTFLEDLCTPNERNAMAERWRVARLVSEGLTYREISEATGASSATITRVARALNEGTGYRKVLLKLRRRRQTPCPSLD